jgi:glutamate/tyrosine decarboxylase-like PLP-dependent enzyme
VRARLRGRPFSIDKAAALLGLEAIAVPCDGEMRMRPDRLREALERRPVAVVATAGTTDFGSLDPLREVAEACEATGSTPRRAPSPTRSTSRSRRRAGSTR